MKKDSTLVIAEAGVNHNGNLELACQLVDAAADAGADLVKFQTFRANSLATETAKKAGYQIQTSNISESQLNMLQKLELDQEAHEHLISHCKSRGIEFFSTGFDIDSLDMLISLGLELIKVPSGEITNLPYLRHVGSLLKPVIISTGMANLGEIEDAILVLEEMGLPRKEVCVLQCNTEYPTPTKDVNLRAMLSIQEAFQVDVGYSDHTLGIDVPIAAVALGAKVIEKHLTIDHKLPGPDHSASLEPNEFKRMVQSIRNIEVALGDGVKRTSSSELKNKPIVRKSIVASAPIKSGEKFTTNNLTVKRPGTGISPMRWDDVIGRSASRNFQLDEIIEL